MADRTFGHLPRTPSNGAHIPPLTKQFTSSLTVQEDLAYPHATIAVAFESVGWADANAIVMMLIQKMLGEWDRLSGTGPNGASRLCTQAAAGNTAQVVSCFDTCYKDTSLFGVYCECTKENIPRLMEISVESLRDLRDYVTQEDLDRAKNKLKNTLLMDLYASHNIVEDIGRQAQMYGIRLTPAEIFTRVDAVDLQTVKDVANDTFVNKPIAVAGYGPIETLPPIEWFREKDQI